MVSASRAAGPPIPNRLRVPWWSRPARFIGHYRPILWSAAHADVWAFERLPRAWVDIWFPLAIVVLALVPSLFHLLGPGQLTLYQIDFTRLRVDDVYTESFVFMAGALLVGALSPALGAFLVFVFVVFDLVAASQQMNELVPFFPALFGRVVSWWLLWLLAVEVPLIGRSMAASVAAGAGRRLLGVLVAGLATGAFAFIWTLATPTIIRTTFTVSYLRGSTIAAIVMLQNGGLQLTAIGAVTAAAVAWRRGPDRLLGSTVNPPAWWTQPRVVLARHIAVAAFLTFCLAGVIQEWWYGLVLFAALAGARPVATAVVGRSPIGAALDRLPDVIRVAIALAVAFGITLLIVPSPTQRNPNTFQGVIIGIAVAVFVVELFTARADGGRAFRARPVAAASMLALGLLLLALLAPALAFADNCADAADCYGLGGAAAAAAGGTGAAIAGRYLTKRPGGPSGGTPDAGPPPEEPPDFGPPGPERPDAGPPPWPPSPGPDDGPPPPPPSPPPLEEASSDWLDTAYTPGTWGPRHDEANWDPQRHSSGACVVTTACMTALGKPDDGHELIAFRRMRDTYVRQTPGGMAVIEDYYRTAPHVVARAQAAPDVEGEWRRIYAELVLPVVERMDADDVSGAVALAMARYDGIKARYGVS